MLGRFQAGFQPIRGQGAGDDLVDDPVPGSHANELALFGDSSCRRHLAAASLSPCMIGCPWPTLGDGVGLFVIVRCILSGHFTPLSPGALRSSGLRKQRTIHGEVLESEDRAIFVRPLAPPNRVRFSVSLFLETGLICPMAKQSATTPRRCLSAKYRALVGTS